MSHTLATHGIRSGSCIGTTALVIATVLLSLNLLLSFIAGALEGLEDQEGAVAFEATSWLSLVPAWIILRVNAFTVRSILDDHFNNHLGMRVPFFGLGTFVNAGAGR